MDKVIYYSTVCSRGSSHMRDWFNYLVHSHVEYSAAVKTNGVLQALTWKGLQRDC